VPTPIPQLNNPRLWIDDSAALVSDDIQAPTANAEISAQENNLCVQLMSVSAGMVGVCLTVIGLFKIIRHLKGAGTIADDLVAIDSLLFVIVCIISYGGMRTADRKWQRRMERTADMFFLLALTFMAVICGIIAWAIA